MPLYFLTVMFVLAFVISFWREPRNLLNAFLFLFALGFLYLSALELAFAHSDAIYLLLLMVFLSVPFVIILVGVFLFLNGFIILKKEGKSLGNSLSLLLGFSLLSYIGLAFLGIQYAPFLARHAPFIYYCFIYMNFLFILFAGIFVAFFLYSILYHILPKKRNYDYIIIHGAGLLNGETVTPLLAKRIDKAIEAFHKAKNPSVKLIPSGGQGLDEKVSEAAAIARYLREKGIPDEVMILEDTSRTTYENLLFSKQLTDKGDNPYYLFVTNDYHVLRTSFYAKKLKMRGAGLGCQTASYYLPSAFIREYVAILQKLKRPLLILSALFLVFMLLSIL
ncbi:YdcF family protein [Streptococcus cuniculi]|uniref:YdcF family protein n=1 Tax=Streptococcus cuniculi TaxID=1432788 RepID=A0A4Y9JDC3_9STRE|nr:YdcF family protein [Streptococcus cuniculi]MBF0778219.1 YdcF family protein [Streptococcus cuniculi]TFU97959.1 YdcF family protein [Streptococcus cuniculi]